MISVMFFVAVFVTAFVSVFIAVLNSPVTIAHRLQEMQDA